MGERYDQPFLLSTLKKKNLQKHELLENKNSFIARPLARGMHVFLFRQYCGIVRFCGQEL